MIPFASAAWLAYTKAKTVSGAISHVSTIIGAMLPHQSDRQIRQLLEVLARRIDALWPALNFCAIWAQDKGSSVADIVFQGRDTLFRVEKFIHSTNVEQLAGKQVEKEALQSTLKGHIRELEFSIQSVNLAVSVVTSSKGFQPAPDRTFSPSALLRSSERVRAMAGSGGDVAVTFGSFYRCSNPADYISLLRLQQTQSATNPHGAVFNQLMANIQQAPLRRPTSGGTARTPTTSSATTATPTHSGMKVTHYTSGAVIDESVPSSASSAVMGNNNDRKRRGSLTEGAIESKSIDDDYTGATNAPTNNPSADDRKLWSQVWPAATLRVNNNSKRRMFELRVDDMNARDVSVLAKPSSSARQALVQDLESTLAFRTTASHLVGLNDIIQHSDYASGVLDVCFVWLDLMAGVVRNVYAFVVHDIGEATDTVDTLRPLDFAYTVRLCTYENVSYANKMRSKEASPTISAVQYGLAHTHASDEELWILLNDESSLAVATQLSVSSNAQSSRATSFPSSSSSSPISSSSSPPASLTSPLLGPRVTPHSTIISSLPPLSPSLPCTPSPSVTTTNVHISHMNQNDASSSSAAIAGSRHRGGHGSPHVIASSLPSHSSYPSSLQRSMIPPATAASSSSSSSPSSASSHGSVGMTLQQQHHHHRHRSYGVVPVRAPPSQSSVGDDFVDLMDTALGSLTVSETPPPDILSTRAPPTRSIPMVTLTEPASSATRRVPSQRHHASHGSGSERRTATHNNLSDSPVLIGNDDYNARSAAGGFEVIDDIDV